MNLLPAYAYVAVITVGIVTACLGFAFFRDAALRKRWSRILPSR